MIKLFIEVRGGTIASMVSNSDDIQIQILDWDNEMVELDKYQPDSVMTDEGFEDYVKKSIPLANLVSTPVSTTLKIGLNPAWIEAHHEIVAFITTELNKMDYDGTVIGKTIETQGTGGVWELALQWTNEFQDLHKETKWDGEFFDRMENFLQAKNNPPIIS